MSRGGKLVTGDHRPIYGLAVTPSVRDPLGLLARSVGNGQVPMLSERGDDGLWVMATPEDRTDAARSVHYGKQVGNRCALLLAYGATGVSEQDAIDPIGTFRAARALAISLKNGDQPESELAGHHLSGYETISTEDGVRLAIYHQCERWLLPWTPPTSPLPGWWGLTHALACAVAAQDGEVVVVRAPAVQSVSVGS